MTSKHTPGPWNVREPNGTGRGWLVGSGDGCHGNPGAWLGSEAWTENQKTNAHLISAAPDLLKALEKVVALGCPLGASVLVDHAIAKARGEA